MGQEFDLWVVLADECLDARSFLCPNSDEDAVLRTRAYALFALYKVHNGVRHRQYSVSELDGAFKGHLREARLSAPKRG